MAKPRPKTRGGRRLVMTLLVFALGLVGWQVARQLFGDQERELRTQVREAVERYFPERAARAAAAYGLRRYSSDPGGDHQPQVVLVHGLDEPGKACGS